jgi:uncharacterized protein with GYD domain
MATHVTLYKYTAQGLQNITDAPKRVETNIKAAEKFGMKIKEALWLQGDYDFMVISESSDELSANAFSLNVLKQGNVQSKTMRAFTIDEMRKILEQVA